MCIVYGQSNTKRLPCQKEGVSLGADLTADGGIARVELVVPALLFHELLVAATLDDAAGLQHHDAVGVGERCAVFYCKMSCG